MPGWVKISPLENTKIAKNAVSPIHMSLLWGSSIRIQSGANGTFGAIKFRFQQGVTSSTIGVPKAFSFSFPPNGPISFCKSSLFGSAWLHPNAPIAEQAWFASFPSAIHPVAEWVSHWITSWFGKSQKCRQSWGRHFWLHQSSGMLYLNMSIDFYIHPLGCKEGRRCKLKAILISFLGLRPDIILVSKKLHGHNFRP